MISAAMSAPGDESGLANLQLLIDSFPATLEEAEREHVLRALRESKWVIGGPNGAASPLGMKRTTLAYRIRKLNIPCRPE